MEGQDWNPVVMRKYKPGGAAAKPTPVNMNAVRRDTRVFIYVCVLFEREEEEKWFAWRGEYERKGDDVSL